MPIAGVAGDQQASLFGHCCFEAGQAKNTYGTGCFMLMNTGDEVVRSTSGLVSTIGIAQGGRVSYALEGSIFHAGSVMQWLRDKLGILPDVSQSAEIARSRATNDGCYLVPAFSGLGAPWWDPAARGTIFGLTAASDRATLVRAACESMAFQFQADLLDMPVIQSEPVETTALGAAYLAGLAVGYWEDRDEVLANRSVAKRFDPAMDEGERARNLDGWHAAVARARGRAVAG